MPTPSSIPATGWQRFSAGAVRLFHDYANWLVSITWKRFFVLSLLLVITVGVLGSALPRWTVTEVQDTPSYRPPAPPKPPKVPGIKIE